MPSIKERLKTVPHHPGCYLYYNAKGDIIYVGKAKDLNKRMHSYFRPNNNLKTTKLVSEINDFSYYLTNSELECLILENKLIKKYNPKYNILLKDDKTYPYIVLTKEEHPRLIKSRSKNINGYYYGPFSSASFVNEIINYINNHSKLRKCRTIPKKKCIYADLNLCYAPCINPDIDPKAYIDEVKSLLDHDFKKLRTKLIASRDEASQKLEFEQAQIYQTLLVQIDEFKVGQIVELQSKKDFVALDFYQTDDWLSVVVVEVKEGIIVNIHQTILDYFEDGLSAIISYLYQILDFSTISSIYSPKTDLVENLQSIFTLSQVHLLKDEREKLDQFMNLNTHEYYKNNVEKITKKYFNQTSSGFDELQKLSDKPLKYIEMYDISHTQGTNSVGARVTYEYGKKNKNLYRKYRLKTDTHGNDYLAMEEVLTRRLSKMDDYHPDLIIMDGGYNQIKIALKVLDQLGIDDVKVIGLSKDNKHQTNAIVNSQGDSLKLKKSSSLYRFLYDIQEEVHRFAIDYHHKRQSNELLSSELDQIEGIGPKRKKQLIDQFGSLQEILNASDEQLLTIIPQSVIDNLRNSQKK